MNIIFDFDGTLNDTAATYVPAFRLAYDHLVDIGYAEPRTFSRAEIMRWVGYSVKDMWDAFTPDLDASEKRACAKIIGDEMDRLALAGKARMFPGVPEALDALRAEGHVLHYLSNCSRAYMDFYREAFGLDRWITGFFCCEDYGWVPKTEIFPDVVRRFGSAEANRELARRAEASTAGDSSAVAVASHVRREFIMVGGSLPRPRGRSRLWAQQRWLRVWLRQARGNRRCDGNRGASGRFARRRAPGDVRPLFVPRPVSGRALRACMLPKWPRLVLSPSTVA